MNNEAHENKRKLLQKMDQKHELQQHMFYLRNENGP